MKRWLTLGASGKESKMGRKILFFGGLFMVLLVGNVAAAGPPVSVSPPEGKEKVKFAISFVVNRNVGGYRWLSVSVVSDVERNDCEHQEEARISYAPKGKRVTVILEPIDKLRWCPGVYRGEVRLDSRVGCGEPGIDKSTCSRYGSVVSRFSFTVVS